MDCYTLIAMVEWYPSDGALRYEVVATTASGHKVTCESSTANCELEGMLCGHNYSVSVRAIGETCSSTTHMTGQLFTGNQIFVQTVMCSIMYCILLSLLFFQFVPVYMILKKLFLLILVIDAVIFLYTHHKPVSIEGFLMYIMTYRAHFIHLNIDLYLLCINSYIAQ